MKAAVEVFIPTSEERPRFGPVEWMWKAESSESYDSDTWRNEQIKDRDSRDDLFQDQMIHLFVRLGSYIFLIEVTGATAWKWVSALARSFFLDSC